MGNHALKALVDELELLAKDSTAPKIGEGAHCVPESLVPDETPGGYTLYDVPVRQRRKDTTLRQMYRPMLSTFEDGDGGDDQGDEHDEKHGFPVPLRDLRRGTAPQAPQQF